MLAASCPSCGAPLKFQSSVSVSVVCSYCSSMVVRTGGTLEAIGKMAALPEDISPLQIGTTLVWNQRHFTLLGRYVMGWDDGSWTEWFMDDGGAPGWLAHAQGFFAVAFEQPLGELATAQWPDLGHELMIGGGPYVVNDLKRATCIGSEGELPFPAQKGLAIDYADATGPKGGFASLEQSEGERRLFVGANVAFDILHLQGMRPIDDWHLPRSGKARATDPMFRPTS